MCTDTRSTAANVAAIDLARSLGYEVVELDDEGRPPLGLRIVITGYEVVELDDEGRPPLGLRIVITIDQDGATKEEVDDAVEAP